jgi:hypothetical protein
MNIVTVFLEKFRMYVREKLWYWTVRSISIITEIACFPGV